jgi:NAD(P)-dependent dehydrogenase (short-subunit alcohol dehydrogenase family)
MSDLDSTNSAGVSAKTVLVIGATGNMGGRIARELRRRGATLRFLVRAGRENKVPADLAATSAVFDNDTGAFDGVDTVVSAVQGGHDTIVDAQLEWRRAARTGGLYRFVASDYTFNYFGMPDGASDYSDVRREFAARAEDERGPVELSGNTTLGPLMNDRYPSVRPTGVYQFVKEHLAHVTK